MARPKKELPPAKTYRVTVRLTEVMYEVLQNEARNAGLPIAEYIRMKITDVHPVVKQEIVFDSKELLEVFRNIGHYGNNLNQIARYLNQGGNMTNEMWKEIKDCVSEIYEIRDAVKGMAGEYRGSH
jgi:hypothetical protein